MPQHLSGLSDADIDAARSAQALGAAIRRRRRDRDWTQAELAAEVGTTQKWISALERGHPRAEMARVLRVMTSLEMVIDARPPRSRMSPPRSEDRK